MKLTVKTREQNDVLEASVKFVPFPLLFDELRNKQDVIVCALGHDETKDFTAARFGKSVRVAM